jgi:hypothetical protein
MHMSVEHIARIVDPVARDLIGVSLSYSGEPLLNRRLPDIVAYLDRRHICTSFPTNLSMNAYARLRGGFARATYGQSMHPVCRRCLGISGESAPPSTGRRVPIPLQVRPTGAPAASGEAT